MNGVLKASVGYWHRCRWADSPRLDPDMRVLVKRRMWEPAVWPGNWGEMNDQ